MPRFDWHEHPALVDLFLLGVHPKRLTPELLAELNRIDQATHERAAWWVDHLKTCPLTPDP